MLFFAPYSSCMPDRIHYTNCPVCHSQSLKPVLNAVDYTVSKEIFAIWECSECTLRFTQDVPDSAHIGPYYKSEDYISHTNTSRGLINKIYQAVRHRTIRNKRRLIERTSGLSDGNLLDIGCGVGTFLHAMKEGGWNVTGLEPDAEARKIASQLYNLEVQEIEKLDQLPAATYDVITLWHVLEHVHQLHDYIDKLKQLLKPGGTLLIAVPNYTSKDAETYGPYWAAYDVPRHLYHFSPKSINRLMTQHTMQVTEHKPMWYDSFYIALLSSRYKNGKSNWIGAAWQGMLSNLKASGDVRRCSSVIYLIRHAAR